jgi:osmotically-inducible protein OsmY
MKSTIKYLSIVAVLFAAFLISSANAQTADKNLSRKVRDRILTYYPQANISVKDEGTGKIKLTGDTDVLYDKLRIFEIVSGIQGVHKIENSIVVNTTQLPDAEILANIKSELNLVRGISEPDLLQIAVSNGVAILKGKVRFQREKTVLETMVSWQEGVKGIVNEVEVMPILNAISDSSLNGTINDLLTSQFGPEKEVQFSVKTGHVTLDGHVSTLWAKFKIEDEIRRIVGVTKVINNLEVSENYGA